MCTHVMPHRKCGDLQGIATQYLRLYGLQRNKLLWKRIMNTKFQARLSLGWAEVAGRAPLSACNTSFHKRQGSEAKMLYR